MDKAPFKLLLSQGNCGYSRTDRQRCQCDLEVQAVRRVYLPEGASWIFAHTGEEFAGGTWIEVEAELSTIPVFLRDGALEELIGKI